jgi:hypothetical protein
MTAPTLLNSPITHLDLQGASTHDGRDRPRSPIVATGRRLVTIANALVRENKTFDESRLMA